MHLNAREIKIIQAALQQNQTKLPFNKTWQKIHETYQIGFVNGKLIEFKFDDLDLIRRVYSDFCKVDASEPINTATDRMELLDYLKEEKSGSLNVFADQLVFASTSPLLPLKAASVNIAFKGFIACIDVNELDCSAIDRLIIVENGTMVTRLADWKKSLPVEWRNSLILYRGHGNNIKQVQLVISQLPESAEVAFFGDFDPFGLNIAAHFYSLREMDIIVPNNWQAIKHDHIDNNKPKFFKQIESSRNLKDDSNLELFIRELYRHIEINQLAIMQENVMRLGELVVIGKPKLSIDKEEMVKLYNVNGFLWSSVSLSYLLSIVKLIPEDATHFTPSIIHGKAHFYNVEGNFSIVYQYDFQESSWIYDEYNSKMFKSFCLCRSSLYEIRIIKKALEKYNF